MSHTIQLLPILHRGAEQILLQYEYNSMLNQTVRRIKGIKWSQSLKGWYLPLNRQNYEAIQQHLAQLDVLLDNATLTKYLHQRKTVLTTKPLVTAAIPPISTPTVKQEKNKVPAESRRPPLPQPEVAFKIAPPNLTALQKMMELLTLKAYSESTRRTYRGEMLVFLQVLGKHSAEALTTNDVKRYLLKCIEEGLSENTVHSRINALKFYYEKVLGRDKFFVEIPRPKKPMQLPKVLGENELRRLFAAPTNIKHKAILFIAYSAGLRVSEVVNLRLEDIDREREQLFIHCSKGKKDRYVRLSILVLDILERYYLKATVKPKNYVFEGLQSGEPYSIRSAQQIFTDAKKKAGIKKTVSFHNLRHSFATHLLEKGVNVLYIRDILGHFDIKTTERYLHVKREMLINIESPLDTLYKKNK